MTRKELKLKLRQRGGRKHHEMLEKALRFYAESLMPSELIETLNVTLAMRKGGFERNVMAKCESPVDRDDTNRTSHTEFRIALQRDMLLRDQLASLAHEMVHVSQRAQGRLRYLFKASSTSFSGKNQPTSFAELILGLASWHTIWEQKDLGPAELIPYWTCPWEVEARKLETRLCNSFFKKHLPEFTPHPPRDDNKFEAFLDF